MPAVSFFRRAEPGTQAYDEENNNKDRILIFLGVPWGLALLGISLRFYIRKFMLHFLGPDDWTMFTAGACAVATYVCFLLQGSYGLGQHMSDVSSDKLMEYNHIGFFFSIFSLAGLCLFRVSLCLSLIRVAKYRTYTWILWAIIILLASYHIALEIVVILACTPVQAVWDPELRAGARCISMDAYLGLALGVSIVNLIINVVLIILPLPVIVSLTLNLRTKSALCFVNLLGFIVIGAAAMKLRYQIGYLADQDKLFKAHYPVWTGIELFFGILATSLPTLRPLFAWLLDTARSTIEETREAMRHAATRQGHFQEDPFKAYIKNSTFTSECVANNSATTPMSDLTFGSSGKKDYFSFLKPRKVSCCEITTQQSCGGVDVMVESKAPRDLEEQREEQRVRDNHRRQASRKLSGACADKDGAASIITRTTEVSRFSRAFELMSSSPPSPMSVDGSMTLVDEAEAPPPPPPQLPRTNTPSRLRKVSSSDAGMVLRAAMQSEEELPRSPSIDSIMRGRSYFKV